MELEIRPIVAAEIPEFRRVISQAFGADAVDDDEARQRFADLVDLSRTYAAFDGPVLVGTAASYSFDLSLPGDARTAMGGLTMVSVQATHRRNGILTKMMAAHFNDCGERGEALSGLFASESSIYGRYGFGDAAPIFDVSFNARAAGVPPAPDQVRLVELDEARDVFPAIYDQVYAERPGRLTRPEAWWQHRHFRDAPEWRRGASAKRYVVAYRDGSPVGYTTYRQKDSWEHGISSGTVHVGELFGIDTDARLSLWSMVSSIDLFPNVEAHGVPIDFELPFQVANPRTIQRRLLDGLYARLLDVPMALEARGYATSDSIVIEVADALGIAAGRFRLEASPEGAVCAVTGNPTDVRLDVADLSSLYLGADRSGPLHRAGRIVGEPDAVRRLGTLLRGALAPACPEVF